MHKQFTGTNNNITKIKNFNITQHQYKLTIVKKNKCTYKK